MEGGGRGSHSSAGNARLEVGKEEYILCLLLSSSGNLFQHNFTAINLRGESEGRLEAILSLLDMVLAINVVSQSGLKAHHWTERAILSLLDIVLAINVSQ